MSGVKECKAQQGNFPQGALGGGEAIKLGLVVAFDSEKLC
jgi:hypothetical protein